MKIKTLQEDNELFLTLDKNSENQKIQELWSTYASNIHSAITNEGIQSFSYNPILSEGFGDTYGMNHFQKMLSTRGDIKLPLFIINNKYINRIMDYLLGYKAWRRKSKTIAKNLEHLSTDDMFKIIALNSLKHKPQRIVHFDRGSIGIRHLRYMGFIYALNKCDVVKKHFEQVNSLCEIGSGFGASSIVFSHYFPNITKYYYFDIHPVIYILIQYLKFVFGDDKIFTYSNLFEKTDKDPVNTLKKYVCLPNWEFDNINGMYDFVFNAASFQEMDVEQICAYCKTIKDKSNTGAILSIVTYYSESSAENTHKKPIQIIGNEFEMISQIDCSDHTDINGIVSNYYIK